MSVLLMTRGLHLVSCFNARELALLMLSQGGQLPDAQSLAYWFRLDQG